jgi:hypothetical protein
MSGALVTPAGAQQQCLCSPACAAKIGAGRTRGGTRAMELNYWKATWPLDVSECPCDVHFVDYLKARGIKGRAIFHFGTGEHHILALENAKFRQPNQVFGVTASKQEYDSYIDLIVSQPKVANSYKAMFVDI